MTGDDPTTADRPRRTASQPPTETDGSGTTAESVTSDGSAASAPLRAGRREFLAAVGAGVAAPAIGSTSAGAADEFTDFVQTDGTQFVVDGQPIYFNGTNNFWLTHSTEATRERIDRIFAHFEELGIDLVRVWANGAGEGQLQPAPGEHDEALLRMHDYVVATARDHGIRLILSLVDNWTHEGGMLQYAEWTGGSSRAHFYRNQQARDLYRNHAETMITRENTLTGMEYREDPAIAAWELANEPRLEADSSGLEPSTSEVRSQGLHREVLGNWIRDMSAYLQELAPNQLISTGSEGHFYREGASYPDGTWGGQDFVEHHSYDTVDLASFHWYPDHWFGNDGGEIPLDRGGDWIRTHAEAAREELGKPAYLGEFNVADDAHDLETKNQHLQQWYDAADEVDLPAMLVWQLVLPDTRDHDPFQVYESESGEILRDYAADVRAKSAGANGEPLADAVAPESLRVGESGTFAGKYSRGASGDVTDYSWSFPASSGGSGGSGGSDASSESSESGGSSASGANAVRRFASAGEAEVELEVTDESGASATDTEVVTVESLPADSFLLEGAGQQVHEDVAEFHFAHAEISGDFTVDAKVASVRSTSPVAQAGILAVNDPSVADVLGGVAVTPSNGTEQVRSYDASAPVWLERTEDDRRAPLWLRLEREGGSIATYASQDGASWTQLNEGQVSFEESVQLGLFVSSNSPEQLCAAQFDGVDWLAEWSATDVGGVEVGGATTAGSGDDPGEPGGDDPSEPPEGPTCGGRSVNATAQVDGRTVCDVDGDGLYRDVDANGRVSHADVQELFSVQHRPAWKQPDYFDFNDNDVVGHGDVVALFEDVATGGL